jgi:PAS domain S-box-containing protein
MKTPSKILIADHQPETTLEIAVILKEAGYQVFEAHNEKDCLNIIFSQNPDILLMEGALPHGDAEAFCKQVKLNHNLPQLHIILMSDDMEGSGALYDFSNLDYFNDFIRKPVYRKELLLKISLYQLIKNMKAAMKWQKNMYDGILSNLSDLVINTDLEGNISNINAAAETVSGWKLREVEGQKADVVIRLLNESSRQPEEDVISKVLQQIPPIKQNHSGILITKEGVEVSVLASVIPLKDECDNLNGALVILHPTKILSEIPVNPNPDMPPSFNLKDFTHYI